MDKLNDKYIEKLSMLGKFLEINDESFFVIFQPHNNRGAKVSIYYDGIELSLYRIDGYNPLIMWRSPNKRYYNLTDDEALKILMDEFGEIES